MFPCTRHFKARSEHCGPPIGGKFPSSMSCLYTRNSSGKAELILWDLILGRPVDGFCEYGNEPSGFVKKVGHYLTSRVTIGISINVLHYKVSEWEFH